MRPGEYVLKTIALKGESCSGDKRPKDRMTIIVRANAAGEEWTYALLIGQKHRVVFEVAHHRKSSVIADNKINTILIVDDIRAAFTIQTFTV